MAPPYMVQLCQRIFNIDRNSDDTAIYRGVCTNWFYEALDHCSTILMKKPGCQKLWNKLMTLKQFLFPENATSLQSDTIQISVHPDLLRPSDCQELANQIARDYIHYIPRYVAVLHENQRLWLVLRGILGLIIISACLFVVAKGYNMSQSTMSGKHPKRLALPEGFLAKNMKRVMYETKYLPIVPAISPQLLQCGWPVVALKMDAKKICDIQTILIRSSKSEDPTDENNGQTQVLERLKNFFHHSGKYRLLISLDLDYSDEDDVVLKINRPSTIRSSGIPRQTRMGIRRKV